MSLVLRIESRYRIELDADDGGELRTVGDLAEPALRPHRESAMIGGPAIQPKVTTLNEALATAAQSGAGLTFVDIEENEQVVTMARVRDRALSIASDLQRRGVRVGDRVALVLPTCPDFVDCFFGVLCAGAVPVPLYPPVRLGKLDEYHRRTAAMLRAADAALVVSNERIHRLLGVAIQAAGPRLGW